jgi:hypothetical protein
LPERTEIHACHEILDQVDGLRDIAECKARFSKRQGRFPFCANPDWLFQHAPVREIDARFQNLAETQFQTGHIEQCKALRTVEITHQIDIRLRGGSEPDGKAKEQRPHRAMFTLN